MKNLLAQVYAPQNFRQQAHELVDILADYLQAAQNQDFSQAIPWQEPHNSLAYWQADFAEDLLANPNDLFRKIIEKSTHLHHPRYMGHQVSTTAPLASLTGMLTGLLNNGMAVYEMGLVSNPIERIVSDWLAQTLGYQTLGGGLLTSGGTLANLTALLAIRAGKSPNDVWSEGTSEKLAILVSEEAHYCIDRAARIMGWGAGGIIKIPTNDRFQMRTELLEQYYQTAQLAGYQVVAVVGSACSTSTGSYDDLGAIADFCEKHQLWFHADGAHGGAVAVSDKYKHLIKGIERADSIVVDFHKMMMIPALCTALLFKRPDDAFQTFHQKAQYLWDNPTSNDWFNSGKRTFECTKLMMAVKVYAMLRTYGEAVFSELIDTLHDLAGEFAQMVQNRPNFELAVVPQSNIVCFRYMADNQENTNELNAQIRRKLLEKGEFYIVQTTLRNELYLRVSLMNPMTSQADLEVLLNEIEQLGTQLQTK
ncbi:MAG: pyridoxal-dependent decarboxylase [Microscillaceae bacterium]|jgi:L-2,4-diaminobutyrate decarboxylase|nr:pyridoxal-dependent decarboxylase [Microscillaceae bacterium]